MTIIFWTLLGIFITYTLTSTYYEKKVKKLKDELRSADDYIDFLEVEQRCHPCEFEQECVNELEDFLEKLGKEEKPTTKKTTKKVVKGAKKKVAKK